MNTETFFAELKRRHVYKVAVTYVVAAWILLQAASILFPAFEAPAWAMKLLVVAVVAGFGMTLVLAWAFALTPEGTRRRKRSWFGLIAAALAMAVITSSYTYFSRDAVAPPLFAPPTAAVADKSMAVLPFKPLLPESRDPVLEVGMADTLITKLSSSRKLIVASLSSVRQSRSEDDPRAIGQRLGVNSVLEGNVQRVGNRLRVTARLIKVADGSSLWAATFDENFTDVFTVQDTIATKVAEALALRLTGDDRKQFAKRYTDNLEAYQLYLTGRYHWSNLAPSEIQKSIDYFQQAIEADASYALAYFGLGEAYRASAINSDTRPTDVMPASRAAAAKAVELDPSLAEPHITLAMVHNFYDWDWAAAQVEARRAIELNPNLAWAYIALGHTLSDLGHHDEGIETVRRARQLEPVSPLIHMMEGARLFYARRYDEAEPPLQKALELNPNFWPAHRYLGHLAIARGDYAQAAERFRMAAALAPVATQPRSMLGYIAARTGDTAAARNTLAELESLASSRYVPGTNIAVVHLGLGQNDDAIRWLERAYDEHDVQLQFLKVDPTWEPLQAHAGFAALLERIGLR